MLTAHIDVVPVETQVWDYSQFKAHIEDGFIYGRGTIDDKHGLMVRLTYYRIHNGTIEITQNNCESRHTWKEHESKFDFKSDCSPVDNKQPKLNTNDIHRHRTHRRSGYKGHCSLRPVSYPVILYYFDIVCSFRICYDFHRV